MKVIRVIVFEADEVRMKDQLSRSLSDGVHGVSEQGKRFWNSIVAVRTVAPDTELWDELDKFMRET